MLLDLTLADFAAQTAAKEPTPGGGAVAAYVGTLGAALGTMAARYSQGRKGLEEHEEALAREIDALEGLRGTLTELVDADAKAYKLVTSAYKLPKGTDEEKAARRDAIQDALRKALQPPLETCRAAVAGLEVVASLREHSNPNLISDVAVAAYALGATYRSAWINVLINVGGVKDAPFKAEVMGEGERLEARCRELETATGEAIVASLT